MTHGKMSISYNEDQGERTFEYVCPAGNVYTGKLLQSHIIHLTGIGEKVGDSFFYSSKSQCWKAFDVGAENCPNVSRGPARDMLNDISFLLGVEEI